MSLKRTGATALTSYLQMGSSMVVSLLLIKVATTVLSPEEYGLWSFVFGTIGYFLLLDFGVSSALARLFAEPIAKNDAEDISGWFYLVTAVLLVQGLVILGLGLASKNWVLDFFRIPVNLRSEASHLWSYCIAIQALSMPMRTLPGILYAQNRVYMINAANTSVAWINLLVFSVLLHRGLGVISYAYALMASQLLTLLLNSSFIFAGKKKIRLTAFHLPLKHLRELFGYSSAIFAGGLAAQVSASAQTMILTRFLGLESAAIYNVTSRMPLLAMQLIWRGFDAFYPRWINAFAGGDQGRALKEFTTMAKISLLGLSGIGVAIILVNPFFISWWTRPEFFAGNWINIAITFSLFAFTINRFTSHIFQWHKKMSRYTWLMIATAAIEISAGILLAKQFGLIGIPIASLLANGLFLLPLQTREAGKLSECSFLRRLLPEFIVGILALTVAALGMLYVSKTGLPTASLVNMTLIAVSGLLAGLLICSRAIPQMKILVPMIRKQIVTSR